MIKLKRYPLKIREDERGSLIQNDYPEFVGKINHFIISTTHKGHIRGNHYHLRKREWFCIFKGKARLYLYDINNQHKLTTILTGNKPEFVEMEPGIVHTLENIGEEDLYFYEIIDEPFNPEDPDTYHYKLK